MSMIIITRSFIILRCFLMVWSGIMVLASLKDIPLGILTGRFLPPDPKLSVVPIVDPRRKDVTRPPGTTPFSWRIR